MQLSIVPLMENHVTEAKKPEDRLARPLALGQVEHDLKAENPAFDFHLVGHAHYGSTGFAAIMVFGIEDQAARRRIRKEAGERLTELGLPVDLVDTKDVFDIMPIPPSESDYR